MDWVKIRQILDERTSVNSETNCWEWQASKDDSGYGQIQIDRILYRVHRLSMMMKFSTEWSANITDLMDFHVLHKCNNPCCWNPDHLYVGTAKDNALDRVKIGKGSQYSNITYCVNGHEFTEENTYYSVLKDGTHRRCRECRKLNQRKYMAKVKLLKMKDVS